MSSVANNNETPGNKIEPKRFLLPNIPTDRLSLSEYIDDEDEATIENGFLGYISRVFTQTCLPYRDPMVSNPNLRAWERRNGQMLLAVEPARLVSAEGEVTYGMPFGKYPRLILPWLTSQIVQKQDERDSDGSLVIEFAASLPLFLRELGQAWGGKKGRLVLEQVPRLFGARISMTEFAQNSSGGQGVRTAGYQIAKGYQLWWNRDGDMAAEGLWGNNVVLSPEFVQDILDSPIPVDLRSVAMMANHGPMAMDILTWMNYRLPAAKRPSLITWEQLHSQFGAQYDRLRDFKAQFVSKLPAVHAVYRDARFEVEDRGLRVFPSEPAVQRKAVSEGNRGIRRA